MAVVGASPRPGSFGERLLLELQGGGFPGAILPVNPRHTEIRGLPCYPTLQDLPQPVDCAVLGLPSPQLEEQLQAAAGLGVPGAVIFANLFEPPAPGRPGRPERLQAIARSAGMALCGGNGMGFLHPERRLRVCGFFQPEVLPAGGVTFLTHSGSAFSALLHNDRELHFNLVVSTGQELVTPMADSLDYALDLPSTKVVALFLETVRDPGAFSTALARAARQGVPVVALTVGRGARGRAMVRAHSGALAGDDQVFDAWFDRHGVLRVETLDEPVDTAALLAAGRRAGPGGLAAIHDSGGERAHLVDVAERLGVPLATIGEPTRARLRAVLEPGLDPDNPLDAWGTGHDADRIFEASCRAPLDDPAIAALAFVVDLTREEDPRQGRVGTAITVHAATERPMAVLSNLPSAIDPEDARRLRRAGVPVLEGTRSGLLALRHLLEWRDYRGRAPVAPPPGPPAALRRRWRRRLATGPALDEVAGLALLRAYGLSTVTAVRVRSAGAAARAARRLEGPVALKTAAPGIVHKSEADGVRLGLQGPEAVAAAYAEMAQRLGPQAVVAAMAPPGVELALGLLHDPMVGPLVVVATGGVRVEWRQDRCVRLPPIDRALADTMLGRLRADRLLGGVRGRPPADLSTVLEAVVRLGALALGLGDRIAALDINPLVCGPTGCWAVEVLVEPRRPDPPPRPPARAHPEEELRGPAA